MTLDDLELRLSRIMIKLGFGHCAASVYSSLLFRGNTLSLNQLSKNTDYSPTAVNLALADLERNDLVIREKQGRKYLYTANERFIQKFERGIEDLLERELRPFRRELERRKKRIRDSARQKTDRLLENAKDAEKRLMAYIASRKTLRGGQ